MSGVECTLREEGEEEGEGEGRDGEGPPVSRWNTPLERGEEEGEGEEEKIERGRANFRDR